MSGRGASAEERADVSLYFGILATFFAVTPVFVMAFRLAFRSAKEGLSSMFTPPVSLDPSKRPLASRVRVWMYARTRVGYATDVAQAVLSFLSCLLFIVVSYMPSEPEWVSDFEDFFTVYFALDYGLRLWMAQDTLSWYFSLVSLLDFITVFPAITAWLIAAGGEYDANVATVIEAIRVFRVLRMFRVIRVIRMTSVGSSSFAFQRQVFVLIATVLSMIFVTAGLYQIFELANGKKMQFHTAVYFATVTVVGRPAVYITWDTITPVFLTFTVMLASTIIPTFVAELIRLWYDSASLETFKSNPEQPHVIVCGDTNVSRLRALTAQYFNKARDPEQQTTLVILAEAKPEGALRTFIDQYKHSGIVRYVRGSARRAADLRRAGIDHASCCIVLNYRSDKDAAAADTEVLSTVMAVKNTSPSLRVLAQLHRPRKRNHLKAVPGWQDGDKSISAMSLGMTLLGVSTRLPGFSTFMVNLIRRGTSLAGLPDRSLRGKTLPWWHVVLYGDVAKPAVRAVLAGHIGADGKRLPPTPIEEYAMSVEQSMAEMEVTPGLVGATFGAAARVAYLRHRVMLLGTTVPVNNDVEQLMPGLPRTYKLHLFPCDVVLEAGMKLVVMAADDEVVERFRVATGGTRKSILAQALEIAGSAFAVGHGAHVQHLDRVPIRDASNADAALEDAEAAAAPRSGPGWFPGEESGVEQYHHNAAGVADLHVPWCFTELDEIEAAERALLHRLHLDAAASTLNIPAFNRFGERTDPVACPHCNKPATAALSLSLLRGHGIVIAGNDADNVLVSSIGATALGAASVAPAKSAADDFADAVFGQEVTHVASVSSAAAGDAEEEEASATAATVETAPTDDAAADASAATPSSVAVNDPAVVLSPAQATRTRAKSLGDDGLGGNDDTDDIVGSDGPLPTIPPSLGAGGIAATARAAGRATVNSMAVRLALPATAVTDVEALAADALSLVPPFRNHVLICGINESIGYLLRAIASMISRGRRAGIGEAGSGSTHVAAPEDGEGSQYDFRPEDIVVLALSKPADAAINAMYPGSAKLLSRVTYIAGNPAEAADLIKAGVMAARAAVVLSMAKAASSADGSDNLSDDTDAIVTTATISKLNPALHVITELLHGSHSSFIRPTGSTLNDAQRGAFIYILEEREANRQRAKLDAAIKRLSAEHDIRSAGDSAAHAGAVVLHAGDIQSETHKVTVLLNKLLKQQARLRAMMAGSAFGLGFVRALENRARAGAPAPHSANGASKTSARGARPDGGPSSSATGLASAVQQLEDRTGGGGSSDMDLEQLAEGGLSNSAIVDVIVGVREEFGANAAANDGAGFSLGGGGGGGGSSKGSGATNDLFGTPSWAAGRVFTSNVLDSLVLETHFTPCVVSITKQLLRAARKQRFVALPMTEAITLARLAQMAEAGPAAGRAGLGVVERTRNAYLSSLARRVVSASRGAAPSEDDASPIDTFGTLFELLLRGWHLLPLGLYRRVHPGKGLRVTPATVGALQVAAGPPSPSDAFLTNRALVSYVFSNPPPNAALSEHDLVYVLLPDVTGGRLVDQFGSDLSEWMS